MARAATPSLAVYGWMCFMAGGTRLRLAVALCRGSRSSRADPACGLRQHYSLPTTGRSTLARTSAHCFRSQSKSVSSHPSYRPVPCCGMASWTSDGCNVSLSARRGSPYTSTESAQHQQTSTPAHQHTSTPHTKRGSVSERPNGGLMACAIVMGREQSPYGLHPLRAAGQP